MAQEVTNRLEQIETIEAVVIRCGCPKGADRRITHGVDAQGNLQSCPRPRKITNLGTIAYNDTSRPLWSRVRRAQIWVKRHIQGD